jgi:2,4-dienoyl-CoA reductase-like NADH-dependent reductase (Old Yellow Enzyme family)
VAPSAIPLNDDWPVPQALDEAGLVRIRDAHAESAKRADRLSFDLVELLGAHGFLLHSFLSPISNRRSDRYGGSLANRMRFPLEVAEAIRGVWPRNKALGMRITGSDWIPGGITPDEAGTFARELRDIGFDYVCVSSGGISPQARVNLAPGLPGAVRRSGQKDEQHRRAGGRDDRRSPPGRSDRRRRQRQLRGACPRLSRRPALGLARRRGTRC